MLIRFTPFLALVAAAVVGCSPPQPSPAPVPKATTPGATVAPPVTRDDVKREVGEAAGTVGAYADQERAAYQKKLDQDLVELDRKIEKLKSDARQLGGKAQEKWVEMQPELEARRAAMSKRLEELKGATAEGWKDIRAASEKAWQSLREGFENASREFESVQSPAK